MSPLFIRYIYTIALDKSGIHSLYKKRHYLDVLFFVQVCRGLKSCFSLFEILTFGPPPSNVKEFCLIIIIIIINYFKLRVGFHPVAVALQNDTQ
jgi:hypothetical protein